MDGNAEPPISIQCVASPDGDTICVVVAGEIDMTTVERFRTGLDTAIDQRHRTVLVDLAGVRFMDSSGIAALVDARNRALAADQALCVGNCRPLVRRVMEVTGVYALLSGAAPPGGR